MAATPNWALWGVSHWPRQDNNSKCNHAWNWNERVQISIHSQQIQIHSRDKSKQSPVTAPTAEDFTLPLLGMGGREGKIRKARCLKSWNQGKKFWKSERKIWRWQGYASHGKEKSYYLHQKSFSFFCVAPRETLYLRRSDSLRRSPRMKSTWSWRGPTLQEWK